MKLASEAQGSWGKFCDCTSRSATAFVGLHWLLEFGALTQPGALANGLTDVPFNTDAASKAKQDTGENTNFASKTEKEEAGFGLLVQIAQAFFGI